MKANTYSRKNISSQTWLWAMLKRRQRPSNVLTSRSKRVAGEWLFDAVRYGFSPVSD